MRNKTLTLALSGLLVLGAGSVLYAQDNSAPPAQPGTAQQGQWGGRGHGRMDPDEQLRHMTKQLDLTADQQNQIKPILVDRQQKAEAVWQNQSLSREDRRSQMQSIREDSEAKIQAVLNDQQKQKYQAMQERMQERRGAGQPGGDNAPPPSSQPQPQ
jgi:periplasmic protein CpxP/Spy